MSEAEHGRQHHHRQVPHFKVADECVEAELARAGRTVGATADKQTEERVVQLVLVGVRVQGVAENVHAKQK